jgi:2-iminobutanoate/2-iminopropanoate deaminase
MKEIIHTPNAPQAIGPYSQAVKINGFVYVSGQIPVDPATGAMAEANFKAQTMQSMKNIQAILAAAGLGMDSIVKTTIFLSDLSGFGDVNEVYGSFFTGDCPARACFEVGRLPKDAMVEIEAVAAC